jgi:hypothetical protein
MTIFDIGVWLKQQFDVDGMTACSCMETRRCHTCSYMYTPELGGEGSSVGHKGCRQQHVARQHLIVLRTSHTQKC